ncbi:putative permease [Terriglobus roseus DSM 18391]|uniref:Putative permease n=1 Tax=Terriglobus roseus (strain DSM 18391 / NRRL B-41598 / KBS 63) TaxID=926566 RepID=I3ZJP4_TERRK|nr:AI-2E family transporter [Terriglobus roseus]AFL89462.1 putative permease [Terriglobus roseus DSM 18391]
MTAYLCARIHWRPHLNADLEPAAFPSRQFRETRKHIVFTIALLVLLGVFWTIRHVLGIVYLSGLFAVVLNPIVTKIGKIRIREKHLPKAAAVTVLVVVLFTAITLFFWIGMPPVVRDFRNFLNDLPSRIPTLISKLHKVPMADKIGMNDLNNQITGSLGHFASYVVSSLPTWAEHLLDILTAVILTVYFILEGEEVYKFFLSLVIPKSRVRLANTLLIAEERVSRWLLGQLLLMACVAAYSIIAFRIINVRYYILLGLMMGLTNIIPVAGNLVTILLVALIAAADSWTKCGLVFAAYAIYVQFENAFLTPRIMKSSVDLMGVSVLIALLCGTAISGIPGALIAVPTAAVIVVFADEYLVQHEDPERLSVLD